MPRARRKRRRSPGVGALEPAAGTGLRVFERHRFAPLAAPLAEAPSFVARAMFGCVGCFLGGRLVLVLADRREPWQGLLLPVERAVHRELVRTFPELVVHPVLRKWLYLPETAHRFEATAREIVRRIEFGDERFGVEPSLKLPRRRAR